ncbi:hypothetical protein L3V83_06420 [Thiotrichales bacterium 19X7-9]|nr:hypothetical protein [Thiotrichales bacterium 19X7-9]
MTNLSHLTSDSLIKVDGIEKEKFLQGQITQNIELLNEDTPLFSAYCNAKGRIISLFEIFKSDEIIYLSMPKATAEVMLNIIQKYALFSKVTLSITDQYYTYAIWGEESENLIETLPSDAIIIQLKTSIPSYKIFTKAPIDINDSNIQSESQWQDFLIQSKYPTILPNNSEHFLPAELNLNSLGVISLSKGCYVGQEVIARMHYLGQTKKALYNGTVDTKLNNIQLKDKVLNQDHKAIGEVVNFSFNEEKQQTNLLVLMNQAAIKSASDKTFILNDNPIKLIV